MIYPSLESFHREDPARASSGEADFGLWRGEQGALRVAWLEQTGELYGHARGAAAGGEVELLARLPHSGHPSARCRALLVEALLAGWEQRLGRPGSLAWLRERLSELARAELAPIDWTVACASEGCPRQGERIASRERRWGQACESCLSSCQVVGHGLSPARLEAKLRAGAWWLAERC